MKILVVDDDELLSKALSEECREGGFEVFNAYNGVDALELAKKEKPDFILLDITMPKKNGIDTLRELKELPETKDIPVFILTVSENEDKLEEAIKLGASDAVIKSRYTLKGIVGRVKTFENLDKYSE